MASPLCLQIWPQEIAVDALEVKNNPQQGYEPQAISSKNWLMNFEKSLLKLICLYFTKFRSTTVATLAIVLSII